MDDQKITTNSMGRKTLHCVGVSTLVKDKEAIFLSDLEEITIVDPADVKLVPDNSPFFRRAQLFIESQWRQRIPTDTDLHIGNKAAMDLSSNEKTTMIHLFGIMYAEEIKGCGSTPKEILKLANMPESYQTEISKGVRLSKYVDVKERYSNL